MKRDPNLPQLRSKGTFPVQDSALKPPSSKPLLPAPRNQDLYRVSLLMSSCSVASCNAPLIGTNVVRNLRPGGRVPLGSPTPGPKVPSAKHLLRRFRPAVYPYDHPYIRGPAPYIYFPTHPQPPLLLLLPPPPQPPPCGNSASREPEAPLTATSLPPGAAANQRPGLRPLDQRAELRALGRRPLTASATGPCGL